MPHCVEVCVENPSPGFCKLRDKTDARVLQELGYFDHLQSDSPDWNALARALKWSRTQLRHLHSSVVRKVVKSLQSQRPDGTFATDHRIFLGIAVSGDEGSLCEVDGHTYYAGQFAMVRGADNKGLLAQLLGINPSTKLVRVRWIYRMKDVSPSALAQSSHRWRALLMPGSCKKAGSLQEQGEVFFVFHEDFIHHQALVEPCTVRFMSPEGSSAAGEDFLLDQVANSRSTFLCRFVYDPTKQRIFSLKNKLIKTRYRRVLDVLMREADTASAPARR